MTFRPKTNEQPQEPSSTTDDELGTRNMIEHQSKRVMLKTVVDTFFECYFADSSIAIYQNY